MDQSSLWGIPSAVTSLYHQLADTDNPNKTYPQFPLSPLPLARDEQGNIVPAMPNIARIPVNALSAIAHGEKWWMPGAQHGSDVGNLALMLAGGATSPRGLPVEGVPPLYETPQVKARLVADNTPPPPVWDARTGQPTYMNGRPTYDPRLGYQDPLRPTVANIASDAAAAARDAQAPSNVVPLPTAASQPPTIQIPPTIEPGSNVVPFKTLRDLLADKKGGGPNPLDEQTWVNAKDVPETPLTPAQYEAKRDAGLGRQPYDAVWINPGSGVYSGAYKTESLPAVLDHLDVERANQNAPTHNFTHPHTGAQTGVMLTGNTRPDLGLTEIVTPDGQRAWMPSEHLSEVGQ